MNDGRRLLGTLSGAALLFNVACTPEVAEATDQVTIDRVVVNQAVALELGGPSATVPEGAVPLIAGRRSRWSVYLVRASTAHDRDLDLEIVFDTPSDTDTIREPIRMLAGTNSARFDVWLEGSMLPTNGPLRIRVQEPIPVSPPEGGQARWSLDIPEDLLVETIADLEIEIVPVHHVYYSDCEPWDPALVDLETWREEILQQLPLADVRWSMADPLPWPHPVDTFNDQLAVANLLAATARADPAPARVRLGVARRCSVCDGTCVQGIADTGSLLTHTASAYLEVFQPDALPTVTVHEIGHTAGLDHAPCPDGIPRTDPDFPVPDGRIDVLGLGIFDELERKPASTFDVMSYCQPHWVSRYDWLRLLDAFRGWTAVDGSNPKVVSGLRP